MKGSPAGLARIDALFHSHGYTLTFTNAPVPFGAFPSLHAGSATMEALFCSYFFPIQLQLGGIFERLLGHGKRLKIDARMFYWSYAFWLYWCTMYLMHHYLVDLVGGGCLATLCFYLFLDDKQRHYMEEAYPTNSSSPAPFSTLQASHSQINLQHGRARSGGSPSGEEFNLNSLGGQRHGHGKDEEKGYVRKASVAETLFNLTEDEEVGSTRSRPASPKPKTPPNGDSKSAPAAAKEEAKQGQQHRCETNARDSFDNWAE